MDKPTTSIIHGAKVTGLVFCNPKDDKKQEIPSHSNEQKISKKAFEQGQWQGFEAGKKEGYEMGFQQGQQSAQSSLNDTLALLSLVTRELREKKEKLFEDLKPEIIKLSLSISESLLQSELSDSNRFIQHIHHLLEQAQSLITDEPIHIHLAPQDYERVLKAIDDHEKWNEINFVSDKTVEQGNTTISSSLGLLNFDIKRLLNDLEIRLLGNL